MRPVRNRRPSRHDNSFTGSTLTVEGQAAGHEAIREESTLNGRSDQERPRKRQYQAGCEPPGIGQKWSVNDETGYGIQTV